MCHPLDMKPEEAAFRDYLLSLRSCYVSTLARGVTRSGKSKATFTARDMLRERANLYTSITLASLHRLQAQLTDYEGHMIIDDLGAEKSLWSRLATVTVLATLVHTHYVHKLTMSYEINVSGFNGSASMNVQPILMNSLIQSDDWIAVVRDKVLRYYHLIRPRKPKQNLPIPETITEMPFSGDALRVGRSLPIDIISMAIAGNKLGRTIHKSKTAQVER